jgi:hypothetical protein
VLPMSHTRPSAGPSDLMELAPWANVRRVIVVGPGAAGKSTLAVCLCEITVSSNPSAMSEESISQLTAAHLKRSTAEGSLAAGLLLTHCHNVETISHINEASEGRPL